MATYKKGGVTYNMQGGKRTPQSQPAPTPAPTTGASGASPVSTPATPTQPKGKLTPQFGSISQKGAPVQNTEGLKLSTGETITDPTKLNVGGFGDVNMRGQKAKDAKMTQAQYDMRNDLVAKNAVAGGLKDEASVKAYLEKQPGFLQSTPQDQANTIKSTMARIGAFGQPEPTPETTATPETPGITQPEPTGAPEPVINPATGQVQEGTDIEKRALDAQSQDEVMTQMEYMKQVSGEKDYATKQREKSTQIDALQDRNAEIQASQQIKQAADQVANLKQNLGYLGTQGKPGVSAVGLDAVGKQIADAQTMYNQIVEMASNASGARKIGHQQEAMQFEKQMTDLNTQLHNNVNQAIQDAMNGFTQAEQQGMLDSPEAVEKVGRSMFENLDRSILGITTANSRDRKLILDRYSQSMRVSQQFYENKGKVNQELSAAQGFMIDGNGNPIISAKTGGVIPMPKKPPMEPVFDAKSGKLIQFSTDDNGNITANVDQVIDEPTFQQKTITNYASLVSKGALKMDDVPEEIRNTDAFGQALTATEKPAEVSEWKRDEAGRFYRTGAGGELEYKEVAGRGEQAKPEKRQKDAEGKFYRTNQQGELEYKDTTKGGQTVFDEPVVDTGIKNVYGSNVKLKPAVASMVEQAQASLRDQGIDLQIGDSTRSFEVQDRAYKSGKAGVAPADKSFHVKGQAIDLSQTGGKMNDPKVFQALRDAGLQQHPGERRHRSAGEFGGDKGDLQPTEKGSFNQNYTDLYENYLKTKKIPTADLKQLGMTADQFLSQTKAYEGERVKDPDSVAQAEDLLRALTEIRDHPGMSTVVGAKGLTAGFGLGNIPGTEAANFQAKLDNLTSLATLPNLGKLKGPMSDKDREFLSNASTILKPSLSESEFKKEVDRLIEVTKKNIPQQGGSTATPSGTPKAEGAQGIIQAYKPSFKKK